jgi:hypothetical protein
MMFPPIGFASLLAYGPADASGFATTWFVTTTATPNWADVSRKERGKEAEKANLVGEAL